LKFPKGKSENLLVTILSSYITVYFFDTETSLIIGQTFINFKNVLLSLLSSNETNIENFPIYNNTRMIGYIKFKCIRPVGKIEESADIHKN
jgi:hypothetical protein